MIDLLVEPMGYEFMRRALLVVTASGLAGSGVRASTWGGPSWATPCPTPCFPAW